MMFVIKNPQSMKQMFNYCIVVCYTDQFSIQFDLVRITSLKCELCKYVKVFGNGHKCPMQRENCLHWLSCIAHVMHCVISGVSKMEKALGSKGVISN